MATCSVWETVVWEKLNKAGKWCPYSEDVCHLLEESTKRDLNTVWLGDVDINLKFYYVKLNELVQISEATGIHYPIRRRCFTEGSAISTGVMWQWSGDRHNTWNNYDVDVNNYIEEAYLKGKEVVDISGKFPDYNYKLDLRKMQQRNKRTRGRRAIRRALSSPYPVAKCSVDDAKEGQSTSSMDCNDTTSDCSENSDSSTTSESSSAECRKVKAFSSNHLMKHVAKFLNKLKKPIDTDSDDKSDNSGSLVNKKQCTNNSISTSQIGASSIQSSNISNASSSDSTESELAACSASNVSDDHEEPEYAIVNGKPWYNHWTPHTNASDIKPVPGINPPVSYNKKSRKKKRGSTVGVSAVAGVSVANDVESVMNQYTEKIRVLHTKENEDKECVICFEDLFTPSSYSSDTTIVKLQMCHHIFHKSCLKAMYNSGPREGCIQCPICKTIHGEKCGTQPPGTMDFHVLPYSLPGYSDCNTIRIIYDIPAGVQGPEHPNPGKRYTARGFPRRCYLPDNDDGRKVLTLLVKAWERRLIFTVGSSSTTGEENTVTWNEIHHKTEFGSNKFGHGFPDSVYFENVMFELAAHGVTES